MYVTNTARQVSPWIHIHSSSAVLNNSVVLNCIAGLASLKQDRVLLAYYCDRLCTALPDSFYGPQTLDWIDCWAATSGSWQAAHSCTLLQGEMCGEMCRSFCAVVTSSWSLCTIYICKSKLNASAQDCYILSYNGWYRLSPQAHGNLSLEWRNKGRWNFFFLECLFLELINIFW